MTTRNFRRSLLLLAVLAAALPIAALLAGAARDDRHAPHAPSPRTAPASRVCRRRPATWRPAPRRGARRCTASCSRRPDGPQAALNRDTSLLLIGTERGRPLFLQTLEPHRRADRRHRPSLAGRRHGPGPRRRQRGRRAGRMGRRRRDDHPPGIRRPGRRPGRRALGPLPRHARGGHAGRRRRRPPGARHVAGGVAGQLRLDRRRDRDGRGRRAGPADLQPQLLVRRGLVLQQHAVGVVLVRRRRRQPRRRIPVSASTAATPRSGTRPPTTRRPT